MVNLPSPSKKKKTVIIKVAFLLPFQAQQMTMQAMAMSNTPVSSPPTSPITSPPTSPLLPHLVSPYAVLPPSPYANMPPSPYANFSPNPYATADHSPSLYPPTEEPTGQPQPDLDPGSSSTNTVATRPEVSTAAQVSDPARWRLKTRVTYCIMALTFINPKKTEQMKDWVNHQVWQVKSSTTSEEDVLLVLHKTASFCLCLKSWVQEYDVKISP